jgi:L-aminopeptidase/D-esterase-like protein
MEERKRGYEIGAGVVPIIPAAVIFDLGPLGDFKARPTADMAYAACDSAMSTGFAEGSVGVGTGATVGKAGGPANAMKGGFGVASRTSGHATVCAAVVVNALGDVRDASGAIIAGARAPHGGFLDSAKFMSQYDAPASNSAVVTPQHTTLCVVATNVVLERNELAQLARAAGAALFRRITPVGTSFDGDIVFALCPPTGERGALMPLEVNAVGALEEAIERGVRLAKGRDGIPGIADHAR